MKLRGNYLVRAMPVEIDHVVTKNPRTICSLRTITTRYLAQPLRFHKFDDFVIR
jgi:predicted RNA-binding protein YlqC (UPF0109 family)